MATWADIERAAPELARRVRQRFEMGVNKTTATLRADGAPRISGIELDFTEGEVRFGMGGVKLADVRRDPRVAVHCPTFEVAEATTATTDGPGDAKLAGVAVEVAAPADNTYAEARFFRVDITEVVLTYVGEPRDHLVIESWHQGVGLRRRTAV